jgi:hypothetical protein
MISVAHPLGARFASKGSPLRAVLNEVRRVLIMFSKLVVHGAFPPVTDHKPQL